MRLTSSRCLQERRDMLRNVLQTQIKVAHRLASTEGKYSRDTVWAWDVVEEISRKISMIEMNIHHLERYSFYHRDKIGYDTELAERMYDI